MTIKALTLSLVSIECGVVNDKNISLEPTQHNDFEYSDEEWLKAKHRILDDRMEYRNLMKTNSNAKIR
jgi:hypothetical protein